MTLARLSVPACLVFLLLGITAAQSAPLAAFTVVNTDDAGPGSLRQAILDANAATGGDIITIDISPTPTGVVSITPTTALPKVTGPVSIQAAADNLDPSGLPYVRVDGSTFGTGGSPVYGLEFDIPIPSTSFLGGLAFTRWLTGNTSAIRIFGTGQVTVGGILVGTDQSGASLGNYGGIEVWNGSTIGGPTAASRNVIVDSSFNGVWVLGPGAVIQGNWIGVGIDGTTLDGNGRGVQVLGSNVTVGGSSEAEGNRILGNGVGVHVAGGTGTTIRHNSIDGSTTLGIDLGFPQDGVTPNDAGDPDTGANDLQNFPVLNPDISSATEVGGTLNSDPSGDYTIDVYDSPDCDPTGNGEGATHVASFSVATDGSGDAPFGERPLSPAATGFLTATATDASGNTSEFSSCLDVSGGGGGGDEGSLAGSRSAASGSFNLTTEGSADWAVWGHTSGATAQCTTDGSCSTSLAPNVSKTGGAGISDLVNVNPGPTIPLRGIGFVAEQPFTFNWSDGSPVTSRTGARTGLQHNGGAPTNASTLGTGFSFTVPADTTPRTLRVWVALNRAGGQLTATLSDGSAAAFSDSFSVGVGDFVGSVYTLDYNAATEGQTLTVTWVENADNCAAFRCDNASIHAVALEGPQGPRPPVLTGAVPDAHGPGSDLGVAGAWDSGSAEPGQTFDVTFYAGSTCGSVTPFASTDDLDLSFETNNGGIGAFAVDGLPNRPVGTYIAATVEGSGLSNCVVADRNNVSWPTAFPLASGVPDNQSFLRSSGQARWFKVPVLANSRLNVTLRNLPADYDLVVFKDIQAKYDDLVTGAAEQGPNLAVDDLDKQGAETPADAFNTSQYNPSSWDPTNWKPDLNANVFTPQFSPTEFSPTEFSASFTSPTEFSPTEFSPTEFSPTEFSPTEFSPTEFSGDQYSRDQWATFTPADPRVFSTAQTASLVAVSAGKGTADETVAVNTWNNTGFFYVRVQGKNGSFDADTPFALEVSTQGISCTGVLDTPVTPPVLAPGTLKTLILTSSGRPGLDVAALTPKLNLLAAHSAVAPAAVVDVSGPLATLNAQADGKPECPYAKNLVAAGIKDIVGAYRAANPSLQYVVVAGGDNVIPFYRYPDPALLGNESLYVPPVGDNTASQASLRLGYVLSDDFLASDTSVSLHGNEFPVPNLAIGRLVETRSDIEGMIDSFVAPNGSVLAPTTSLVTGYSFLTDAATNVKTTLASRIGGAAANHETLITNRGVSPGTVGTPPTGSWTASDLRRELLTERNDVVFLAGHFSANDALAADYRTNVLTTELGPVPANLLAKTIVFSAGCHSGYNIVNEHSVGGVTQPLDWAQAFAQKKVTLIAGTGYQYGDSDFLAHSERIYAEFARQLGGAVGSSLLRSKQLFLEQSPGLSALDEKALLQTTLFGLPMLSVSLTPPTLPGAQPVDPNPVGSGPGVAFGLEVQNNFGVSTAMGPEQSQVLNGLGGAASWFEGTGGRVAVKPMQPVLPLSSANVTAAGRSLRGVLFTSGTYTDTTGTVPLTAAPATELRGIHAPFHTDVFFPPQPWTANYFGALSGSGNTQLHVTPVQHRSESPQMTRRKFNGNMNFRLFYTGPVAVTPGLSAPPAITAVDTSFGGGVLTFSAHVVSALDAAAQEVWVTQTDPPEGSGTGQWSSIPLQQDDEDRTLWTGSLSTSTPSAHVFMVQAASSVGRVAIDTNLGAFYQHGSIPGTLESGQVPPAATSMAFDPAPPASVPYRASFNVTVDLDGPAACLNGRDIHVDLGGVSLPGTTNASGTATVAMRATVLPGQYQIVASADPTPACASSDTASTVQVVNQPTALAIAFPYVTLTASTTPLHDRTVIVTLLKSGAPNQVHVGRTDPQGRVRIPEAMLAALAQGGYTVTARYEGEPGYAAASATPSSLNVIRRGSGTDNIVGTAGDDLIIDAGGTNTIDGRAGNDTIIAGGGTDNITGGDGNDTIDAGDGTNVVSGGSGNDTITTGSGTDTIDAGTGNDTINAGNGTNTVQAGSGDDVITAGSGRDVIDGGSGFDFCSPGGGSNTVRNCEG